MLYLDAYLLFLPVLVKLVPDLLLRQAVISCSWQGLAAGRAKRANTNRALLHSKQLRRVVMRLDMIRRVNMVGDDTGVWGHREGALRVHTWEGGNLVIT